MKRTNRQNASLHVYCDQVANALNNAGYDMVKTMHIFKQGAEIPWSMTLVKETLFKQIMQAMYPDKQSTTELETHEMTAVYDVLNRFLATRFEGLPYIPWPSLDEQYNKAIGR